MKALFALAALALAPSFASADSEFPSSYPTSAVTEQGCREGQVELFWESVPNYPETTVYAYYICHNGRFERLYY